MKLNSSMKPFSTVKNWMGKILFSFIAIALVWQSSFFVDTNAAASPAPLFATSGANQIENTADRVREGSKDLIRDSQKNVKETARKNAAKVDQADDKGSAVERKAQRDKDRIEKRADEHAARTEKAVDDSMNGVKGVVENIKDAFTK